MTKTYQKIIAAFSLASLLIVVAGFCYAPTTEAYMGTMHGAVSLKSSDCHQQRQDTISQKSIPLNDNSVRPCCVDRHDKTPTTSVNNFSGITDIVLVPDSVIVGIENVSAQKISFISSGMSPPKPDKLSSVLRLE